VFFGYIILLSLVLMLGSTEYLKLVQEVLDEVVNLGKVINNDKNSSNRR